MNQVTEDLVARLLQILSPDRVLADPVLLHLYKYDGGLDEALPEAVVLPETTEEVAEVVKACAAWGVPFVPRGAGTSLSGGPVPVAGGVVICLTRMNQILQIDYDNLYAVVQPGVVNLDFQDALAAEGYFYAPDPASEGVCTLGGNVAENSGGPHCLKYGVTTNHILGLEVVLPNGQILQTNHQVLPHLGYDLTGLLVGSEGTFGVVTEITCRIMPLPQAVTTMLAIFDDLDEASQAVSDIIADGIIPASLEMMDNLLIQAVEQSMQAGYPRDAEAVLIIEVDGLQAGMNDQIQRIQAACRRNNVDSFQTAQDERERMLLWRGRKGAFGAVAHLAPSKISSDIAVPRTVLPQVLHQIMELGKTYDLKIGNVFHAGDGNLHPQVLFDPRDPDQVRRAKQVDDELTQLAVDFGGVLSGEHGIGSQKRKWMTRMFGPAELSAMGRIKQAFDPHELCNPGKVLPEVEDFSPAEPAPVPEGDFAQSAEAMCVQDDEGIWQPYDSEAVTKLLTLAARTGQRLAIRGAGTKSGSVAEDVQAISTLNLNHIPQLDTDNLTATVQAGIRLAELNQALVEEGQMLPLRPAHYEQATVGGVIATADSGPHRLLYGTARDLVTGLEAVLADGSRVRFGRCCVKNVSGYALEKLLIGSYGTLGLITEVTLRTRPLPERCETLMLTAPVAANFSPLLRELRASIIWPAAAELLNSAAASRAEVQLDENDWRLLIACEGLAGEVTEQLQLLAKLCERYGVTSEHLPPADYDRLWQQVANLDSKGADRLSTRLACPASETCSLAEVIDLIMTETGYPAPITAAVNLGSVCISLPADEDSLRATAPRLQQAAKEYGASFAALPVGRADVIEVCGDQVVSQISARIKASLDPHSILPGLAQR